MKRWKQILFRAFIFACLAVLFGPFLVPVPELGDLVNEKEFADPDSKFIEVNDVTIPRQEPEPEFGPAFAEGVVAVQDSTVALPAAPDVTEAKKEKKFKVETE